MLRKIPEEQRPNVFFSFYVFLKIILNKFCSGSLKTLYSNRARVNANINSLLLVENSEQGTATLLPATPIPHPPD